MVAGIDAINKHFDKFYIDEMKKESSMRRYSYNFIKTLALDLLKHEGYREQAYYDTEGLLTIGIGHLVQNKDDIYPGQMIDEERIIQLFFSDIKIALNSVPKVFDEEWEAVPDAIKLVIINMIFNLGINKFKNFKKMIQAVKYFSWERMADEMVDSRWYIQVKSRSKDLVARVRNYNETYKAIG